jgi:acyl-CoA synthetase (AMP-forming)/AMP-acid ligase II/lauroyl/myristoyl acyltransferase/acyl carrier protein
LNVLEDRAREKPDGLAFAALKDSLKPYASLTYRQLQEAVSATSAHLQTLAGRGERVVLLYAHPFDFLTAFLGCLRAGLIAIPTPLPNTFTAKRVLARMQGIFQDAHPALALTTSDELPNLEEAYLDIQQAYNLKWVATDQIPASRADLAPAAPKPSDVAYLQYTSGSTSAPKGVMITHGNIMHQVDYLTRVWTKDGRSSGMSCWMPYYHDMGLFSGILFPIYLSIPCYLMAPISFIRRPETWLQTVSRYRLSHTAAPVFAFDLCAQKLTPEQRASLDLSCLDMACLGAEPIHPGIVRQFIETFAPHGFRPDALIPGYGLAEATLAVTVTPLQGGPRVAAFSKADLARRVVTPATEGPEATALVGSGRPLADVPVLIVDETTMKLCGPNQIGEIWVGGPSVAAGYWEKEEDNARVFQARLANGEGPFLRTGDLGFFHDGQIYIAGRIKDIMIFQGQNFYPQDIEWTVQESHPLLQKGGVAAFSVEAEQGEQLVVTQELASVPKDDVEFERIASSIRRAVAAQHSLATHAVVLIRKGTIPKTSSGKIQHHAARADFLSGKTDTVVYASYMSEVQRDESAPRTELEAALAEIFAEVLKVSPVGVEDNFFERGGDSLAFLQLAERVEERLGLTLPFERPVEELSVRALARVLGDEERGETVARPDRNRLKWRLVKLESAWNKFFVRLVPYSLGDGLARRLGASRLVQRLFFAERIRRLKRTLASMGHPAPSPALVAQTVSANLLYLWRVASLNRESEFARGVRVTGREHIERARAQGRGVIVLHSHFGLQHLGTVPILDMDPDEAMIIGGSARTLRVAGLGKLNRQSMLSINDETVNDISSLSFQLAKGKRLLERAGILFIAGDGFFGLRKLDFPFLGRSRPFGAGFAEVALTAGADVIPVFSTLAPNGDVEIVFHPPLTPSGANREEQVRSLVEEYVTLLEAQWRTSVPNIRWSQMRKYLALPPLKN